MPGRRTLLRVAVGSPERPLSTTYNVFASSTEIDGTRRSDVYLAARPTAGVLKVSLHASGDWRLALTDEEYRSPTARRLGSGNNAARVRQRWPRPEPNIDGFPIVLAVRVIIPFSELRERAAVSAADVHFAPPPPDGHYGEFQFMFCPHDMPMTEAQTPNHLIVDRARLITEDLVTLYRVRPETPQHRRGIARAHADHAAAGLYETGQGVVAGYLWFNGPQKDGSFALVEVASTLPQPAPDDEA